MTENNYNIIQNLCANAAKYQDALAQSSLQQRNQILHLLQQQIHHNAAQILRENAKDVIYGRDKNLSDAMIDRLVLNEARIQAMCDGLAHIIEGADPLHQILAEWQRDNGLHFQRISVPLGVIGVIYESRPNVTIDAASLCLKAGNAVILRGGSESYHSSYLLTQLVQNALHEAGMPKDVVAMIPTREREAVSILCQMQDHIDVLVPRGGKGLVKVIQDNARMPVFAHLDGNCHLYIDNEADTKMVDDIIYNAKLRRTGICGALESLVVHADYGDKISSILQKLVDAGVTIKADKAIKALFPACADASEEDYYTEYLAPIISVKMVGNMDEAISHINHYGSHHTDGIITQNTNNATYFMARLDSAICLHNASTQFADGYEFGFGGEIGIATGKMHARGPVGAAQLTTYKYCVTGQGTTRP